VRITINLPELVIQSAKRRASEHGVTLSALVEAALQNHLAVQHKRSGAPFRLHSVRGKLVQPNMDLDRTSALAVLDDESGITGGQR
jgi:hypothetical protein